MLSHCQRAGGAHRCSKQRHAPIPLPLPLGLTPPMSPNHSQDVAGEGSAQQFAMSMRQDNNAADSRRRALFRPARRGFYREILGVRVNLLPLVKKL